MSSNNRRPKVIVIGAGISGLACAKELSHRKYDVLIVEARGRPGGRLKGEAILSGGTTANVDVGGALIHGIDNNPIYQVCDQMGISTIPVEETVLLEANGEPVDNQVDEQVSELFNQCLDDTFDKISSTQKQQQEQSSSFGALFDTTVPPDSRQDLLFQWHQANLELSCGASFSQLGHDWNDDEPYEYTGAHVALQQSWNAVTTTLAQEMDILYNSPIQSIKIVQHSQEETTKKRAAATTTTTTPSSPTRKSRRLQGEEASVRRSSRSTKGIASPFLSISDSTSLSYDFPQVRYTTRRKQQNSALPKVQVTLSNKRVLQADAVVCTLPLGILKLEKGQAGHVEFDPPLSSEKKQAIQQLGCGLLNKCVLSFEKEFWDSKVDFMGVVSDTPQLVLNASVVTGQPILVFMFGGDLAFQVEEMTDVEIMNMCMNVLRKAFAGVPEPCDYVVTRWGHDVYAKGAFVYIPPGVEGFKQLQAMNEPIVVGDQPLVLFAGEHTTPYHPSTIHGAFSSGIREAVRLDLKVFPDWNDNLEFEPDHLYKKTFTVKRKFQTERENRGAASSQLPPPPSRKRRHGVMTLRKRPAVRNTVNGGRTNATTRSPAHETLEVKKPSRRSDRIAGEAIEKVEPGKIEDRSLIRSYESYRDWQVISDKAFPVYGDSKKNKSSAQLRARNQQLKPKRAPRLDSAILSQWLAPKDEIK